MPTSGDSSVAENGNTNKSLKRGAQISPTSSYSRHSPNNMSPQQCDDMDEDEDNDQGEEGDEDENCIEDSQSINAGNGEWTYEEQFKQVGIWFICCCCCLI